MALVELVDTIEDLLWHSPETSSMLNDQLEAALEAYTVDIRELKPFALFDPSYNYTRNLISTDYEMYSLLLLCWNRTKYSPIHDHTSTGCWIKAVQGEIHEIRYERDGDRFCETSNVKYASSVTYMDDSLGFHKVGSPRNDLDAITMHLYTPPFKTCHVWTHADRADKGTSAVTTYYSTFGKRVAP